MNVKLRAVLRHFRKADPILFTIAKKVELDEVEPRKTDEYFYALCYEIISQQLAKSAARSIFSRFKKLFPRERITPERTLKLSEKEIRRTGASWSKARFVRDLAQNVMDETVDLKSLRHLNDADVAETLMQVKGIGPWTAQMFLMFTLGREDVFSHGDLGLRNAIKRHYSLRKDAGREEMERIAKRWSPYRTYACRILWKSLDL